MMDETEATAAAVVAAEFVQNPPAEIVIIKQEEPEESIPEIESQLQVSLMETPEQQVLPTGNPEQQVPPKKPNKGITNIERYNVLVRAYIDAHPHLPRQMQYAEAQQVWRSVRMDPEGAYLAVLRSLHGMALLAQASTQASGDGSAAFEPPKELHPLVLKAIDPTWEKVSPLPPPPVLPSHRSPPAYRPVKIGSKPRGRPPRNRYPVKAPPIVVHQTPGKRPRGRPRKVRPVMFEPMVPQMPQVPQMPPQVPPVKRGPGRPRKHPLPNAVPVVQTTPVPIVQSTPILISQPAPVSSIQPPTPVLTAQPAPVSSIQPSSLCVVERLQIPEVNTKTGVEEPISTQTSLPNIPPGILNAPSSLTITPVATPLVQPDDSIPDVPPVSLSSHSMSISVGPPVSLAPVEAAKTTTLVSDHWEPQPGLSFVQGNGLKMILSRVNNGQPLPEYRRRRRKRSRPSANPSTQIASQPSTAKTAMSPIQGQAADSTVMDSTVMDTSVLDVSVMEQGPVSSSNFECSPDQPFAGAILQYLLDLSELLGSSTSFVVSQETEQKMQESDQESVYSGWLVGEQSIGPKLVASTRMQTKTNPVKCLQQLVNNVDFREVLRTSYDKVKPVAILILEGRKPGDLALLLDDATDCFKDWNLDSFILASQPAVGQHVLCTLENNMDGSAVSSNGCHSSSDHQGRARTMELEQWKNKHLRSGQYYLQLAKCSEQHCCPEWRTPLRKVLPPQGFLPPPVPFAKGEQGPIAPRFEARDMATYGRLCERLVMESLVPRTAFQELPFDFYCPSARNSLSRRVCFDCGHYFCTQELRKLHSQLLHSNDGNC